MLPKASFLLGFVLSTGPMTLHDLRRTIVFQGTANEQRIKMLLEGLVGLCKAGLIMWWLEPNYGNTPPVKPSDFGDVTFLEYWHDFIDKSDLSAEVPDNRNPTLFIEASPELNTEIEKVCYDQWRQEIQW